MKISHTARSAEPSLIDRVGGSARKFLARMGLRSRTPREEYEAALDSTTVTDEQRRTAFQNAANAPTISNDLDEADRAYEQWLKGSDSGELRSRPIPPGR